MEINQLLEDWPNLISKLARCLQDFKLVRQNNRLSSTKRRHGIFSALGVILKPILDFLFICAFHSTLVKTSIQISNKYGDKGSPWRIPLLDVKKPHTSSLTMTEYGAVVTHSLIQLIHFLWNPNCFRSSKRNAHSTLS